MDNPKRIYCSIPGCRSLMDRVRLFQSTKKTVVNNLQLISPMFAVGDLYCNRCYKKANNEAEKQKYGSEAAFFNTNIDNLNINDSHNFSNEDSNLFQGENHPIQIENHLKENIDEVNLPEESDNSDFDEINLSDLDESFVPPKERERIHKSPEDNCLTITWPRTKSSHKSCTVCDRKDRKLRKVKDKAILDVFLQRGDISIRNLI